MLRFENRSIEVISSYWVWPSKFALKFVCAACPVWMKLRNTSKIHCESLTKFYGTRKHWNSYAKLRDINALISDKFKVCVIDHKTKKEAANAKKFQKEFHLHAAGNVPLIWGRKIYICQSLWALITGREQDIAHKCPELRVWCHHVAWWGQRECAPWSWFRKWKRI